MKGFREGIKNLKPEEFEEMNIGIVKKSRENKIYRKGTIEGLVVAGIDGVETFGSYKKDWENSYKTKKKVKRYEKGEEIYAMSTDVDIKGETINKIIHARWDEENNGFNELKNYWNMKHCFIADENAIDVIIESIIMSCNIWEMY